MSPSHMKDRCVAFGIYEAPSQLSKQEFDARMLGLADDLIKLPSIQKHVRKFDLMLPTSLLDEYFKSAGIPPPTPLIVLKAECESPDHMAKVFCDAEFQRVFEGGAELDLPKGNWFAADVATRFGSEVSSPKDRIHGVMIAKVPRHLAIEQFREKVQASHDKYFALPFAQQAFLQHCVASPNDTVNAHIQTAGLTVAEPTFVVYFEVESVQRIMELAANAESAKFTEAEKKGIVSQVDSCGFSADIFTKIDRS
ncbi:hypothetical protein B0H11DRAFT_2036378 [Mycena galericulata]|nr:hypothetical protein B0H11DRAFT_2036378 [Mycena galericulata]